MGFLSSVGKWVGGAVGLVAGAPLGILGMAGGAWLGSKIGGAVGGFTERAAGCIGRALGPAGSGAVLGGLAGLALAPATLGLSVPLGMAIGGLIGNHVGCRRPGRPCCGHQMAQYGPNNGACGQHYGYRPPFDGPPCYPGGGFPGGGFPGGCFPGGMDPQMARMQQMMMMMQMMTGMGGFGGNFGGVTNININFGNQGCHMFPRC